MLDFVLRYWAEWLFGGMAAAMAFMWKKIKKKFEQQKTENDSIKSGVKALLHDRLWQAHNYYTNKGYCSLEDKKNIEYLYEPYAALGGNGTGKEAYDDIFGLPPRPKEDEGETKK